MDALVTHLKKWNPNGNGQLTQEQLIALFDYIFKAWNPDGTGKLSHEQFTAILKKLDSALWSDDSINSLLSSLPDPIPFGSLAHWLFSPGVAPPGSNGVPSNGASAKTAEALSIEEFAKSLEMPSDASVKKAEDASSQDKPQAAVAAPAADASVKTTEAVKAQDKPQAVVAAPAGKKKAVTIGINYLSLPKGGGQLSGCINDSDTFTEILSQKFGFEASEIRQLRDDTSTKMPTKSNIVEAMQWLTEGAGSGDHLFLHYSGHGTQQADKDGDEMDGKDETLVPCDFRQAGMLSDDELRKLLVLPLPKGARLTCIFDCCHSGTVLDLPFKVILSPDGNECEVRKKKSSYVKGSSEAEVVMISGCKDNQVSADIGAGKADNTEAAGAMTTSLKSVIEKDLTVSCCRLIMEMRVFLKAHNFKQLPQLMSEQFLNLTDCFVPETEKEEESPPPALRPPCRRAVTIGINYLSLPKGGGQLSGCINDSDTIVGLLKDTFRFQDSMIRKLRDDSSDAMPTRTNILEAFRWLTSSAQSGDLMFLHFSGHGGQMEDRKGDELDGKDETLIPCDFRQAGQITDDELYSMLVASLPPGCQLIVVLDCCHSGTALDLRFKVKISEDGRSARLLKKHRRQVVAGANAGEPTKAEVIMLSGCKDDQVSADVKAGSLGTEAAAGAMTTALKNTLTPTISCHRLLQNMRGFLKTNKYTQLPQMSSEQFVQLDSSFIDYHAKRHAQRPAKIQ